MVCQAPLTPSPSPPEYGGRGELIFLFFRDFDPCTTCVDTIRLTPDARLDEVPTPPPVPSNHPNG